MPGDYRDAIRGGDPRQQQPRGHPPQHDDDPPTHTQAGAALGYDRSAARVFMSFTSDATRFGAAVYDRDVHTIEAVEGYLDNELVLLRLLLVSHDPDVVFVPSRVLGNKDGGSRRANAILAALTAAAEDDENNTAVHETTRTGGENDNDNDGGPRVDNERRRVIVPLPSHAFERIDVCVAAIREACALPDDAAVHARVSLDAPRQVKAAGALCSALLRDGVLLVGTRVSPEPDGHGLDPGARRNGRPPADVNLGEGGRWTAGTHRAHDPASIRELSLCGYLRVDEASRSALGIHTVEQHPSQYVGTGKEWGLFALCAYACVTAGGRRAMRVWFQRPVLNLEVIDERLDGVSFFADNPGVSGDFEKIFRRRGGCPDAAAVLSSMSANVDKATSGMREWRSVYALLSTASDVLTYVEERFAALSPGGSVLPGTPPVVVKFLRASRGVRELRRVIASCVCVDSKEDADANTNYANGADLIINADDDRTTNAYAPRVRKGVCVDLDDARGLYERLPELLEKVRRTVVDKIPHVLRGRGVEDNLAVVYLPKTGFMLRVLGQALPPDIADELGECEFAFDKSSAEELLTHGSKYSTYYFTATTRELSDRVGDVLTDVHDLEASILRDLRRRVLTNSRLLRDASFCISEIDATMSLARAATSHRMRRPKLTEGAAMRITGARHPLAEVSKSDAVIPNDFECGDVDGRVAVVTGPNQSGKSVYLKSIAACVFLAHVGSFVPADTADIPLFDRVFTRVASRDSLTAKGGGGSFAGDCAQVAQIVNNCTGRSLAIVDEFGKGTVTCDGVGLLAGFLTYVSDLRQPPIALVATHFTEVCDAALVPRVPATQFLTMRVHLPEDDNDINDVNNVKGADDDRVVFLYRAVPGVSSRAYSLRCARDAGLPVSVLARCEALEAVDGGVSGGGVVEPDPGVVRAVAPRVRRNEGVVRALAGLDLGAGFDAARKVIMGAMEK